MNETIKLILSLSLSASILAILLFAVKPLIKNKFSKLIQYCIWIVVLLRLVLPFSFEASIMNELFYGDKTTAATASPTIIKPMGGTDTNISDTSISSSIKESKASGVYNGDASHSRYFQDLFNLYSLYFWLLGVIIALTINLVGYVRFSKHLKQANKAAADEESRMLAVLLNGRNNVRLARNHFVTTPMLIGIIRPIIIIPDIYFDEKQLKNILLHEITHLKHFDIAVKWLTMIATSIHWFNPLMYFIKKEVNHACELACDEAVIKNLSPAEKQVYGDTLISVATEHKYPIGVLQATMCEEKKSLKERLVAIMNHNKKSKPIIILSIILIVFVIFGSIYLGAGIGIGKDTPSNIYISAEGSKTKSADLAEISKYKTPYIGEHTKVLAIAGNLPVPDNYFRQQYISMKTGEKPYELTIYYEAASDSEYKNEWPIVSPDSVVEGNSRMNALVVFCMIDNLDKVTFSFRNSQSEGKLDESRYDTSFTFPRANFEEKYGDLSALAADLDKLQSVLENDGNESDKGITIETPLPEFTDAEVGANEAFNAYDEGKVNGMDYLNSQDSIELQVIAQSFSKAYFSGNLEDVKLYLADKESAKVYEKNIYDNLQYMILKWKPEDIAVKTTIGMQYQFQEKGTDSADYLGLEMMKISDKWKVITFYLEK